MKKRTNDLTQDDLLLAALDGARIRLNEIDQIVNTIKASMGHNTTAPRKRRRKARREWTAEQRQAQADRMRKMWERRTGKRRPKAA
jgi:hypothetical protein